jgi:hydrogenase maturation protease
MHFVLGAPARCGVRGVKAIVGVGNTYRRDEGVGPVVAERLARSGRLPADVRAVDGGTGGLALLDIARGYDRLVLIDAMHAGGRPGQIYVVRPDQVRSRAPAAMVSLHATDLLGVIRLAQAVGEPLPPTTLVGVEPADLGWGKGLSPTVAAQLDAIIAAALAAVQ